MTTDKRHQDNKKTKVNKETN